MTSHEFKAKATALVDDLKGVCASYGLGNDAGQSHVGTPFGPIIARKFTSSIVKFCTVEF